MAEMGEKVDNVDYENLAMELENASPLEIMDVALELFGNDIAIAFRYENYSHHFVFPLTP